ncbi:MAG: SGNH/GDSL hydrolase family protein [Holophagae bacterium]|jgi:lysophospholipase L1-like esterase
MMKKTIIALALVLLATAPVTAQVDFTRYVALGDSLTAGFASGSLMDWYQERSYPAVLAHQGGAPVFELPTVSQPGIGPILELVALFQNGELIPTIAPVGLLPGLPSNAEYPGIYNNLGIPAATLYDMLFQTGDINNLLQGNFETVMFDIVLRNGINTALEQAIGAQPTFVTVWIGSNDVLGAVLAGTPIDGVTMTPVLSFSELYQNAIGALATNTPADIVLLNLPSPTEIPFTTSVPPFVDIEGLGRWYYVADTGPLTDDDRLTSLASALIAQGYGLPGGPPLPDNLNLLTGEPGVVLRAAEIDVIEDRIEAYNSIIADVGSAFGAPVFDAYGFFDGITSGDELPEFGGVTLTADFLLGGIFSFDGIHPQNIGHGVLANELVLFLNEVFDDSIPEVNMANVLFEGDWQDPGVVPTKASDVVFSYEAFDQVWQIFKPKIQRRLSVRRGGSVRVPVHDEVRSRPNLDKK